MLLSVAIAIYNNVGNTELVIVVTGENEKTWSFPFMGLTVQWRGGRRGKRAT